MTPETEAFPCPSCRHTVAANELICPYCGRRYPGMWGWTKILHPLGLDFGFRWFVILVCCGLYLVTAIWNPEGRSDLVAVSQKSLVRFGAAGAIPIYQEGRWWTALSAAWLHANVVHLGFNLFLLAYVSPVVAVLYGVGRLVIIYTSAGIVGFLLTSWIGNYSSGLPLDWQGAQVVVGASGAIFGLVGALATCRQMLAELTLIKFILLGAGLVFLLGLMLPFVDDWVHLGGFLTGYALAQWNWLKPGFPERLLHWWVALACLGLSLLSILASVCLT